MDCRGRDAEKRIYVKIVDYGGDGVCMDVFNCVAKGGVGHDAANEERGDDVGVFG